MIFTREKFERYATLCPPDWRAEALAAASLTEATVEIPTAAFEALRLRHFPDPAPPARPFGLGDAVAAVAQPIAKAIDAVLGTNVQGCGGCQQRKAALNKLVPDVGSENRESKIENG